MSRSFWDTTYVDESWIGTSAPQNSQPNANVVMLIPRMQALIEEYYPGLKLSIGEWSSDNQADVTGGLLVADSLGIFGRYGLDSATYWSDPDPTSAVGLAYWLYRGFVLFRLSNCGGTYQTEQKRPRLRPQIRPGQHHQLQP
jgi:hypothetical protein